MAVASVSNAKVEVRLGSIVEDALSFLYRAEERPLVLFVGADEIASDVEQEFTIRSGQATELNRTDLIEHGYEMMLVTGKTEDTVPIFTAMRNYAGTPNGGPAVMNDSLLKNPRWKRYDVWKAVLHGLSGTVGAALPMTEQVSLKLNGSEYLEVPADALDVVRVGVRSSDNDRIRWVDDFHLIRDHPWSSTGQGLELSTALLGRFDEYFVRYVVPYPTKGPLDTLWNESELPTHIDAEDYLVKLWTGMEDVIALYAAAYRVLSREMSRIDVTEMEQWNSDNAQRYGQNISAARFLWQSFYQRLDEVRRQHVNAASKHRPMVRRINVRSFGGSRGTW